ncbi:hypothetical protein ACFOY2_05440 [Nonomuraea purpurea]|uniref:Minor tail protein n=1 Tax=Nonomuraea purpurea TaxID=1849276 RepID=A0ABV8G1D9_9ACTN
MLAFVSIDSGGTGPISISGGWELVGRVTGPSTHLSAVDVYWRVAAAVEPNTYQITMASTSDGIAAIVAISGAVPTRPTVVASPLEVATSTVFSPAATPSTASGVELRWVGAIPPADVHISWTPPSTYTELVDLQSDDFVTGSLVWRGYASTAYINTQPHMASSRIDYGAGLTVLVASAEVEPPEPPVVQPYAPGKGSSTYRYVVTNLLTREYLGDLDLVGVSFDKRLLQPGAFSATLPIPSRRIGDQIAEIIPRDETQLDRGPGVITIQVIREGEPWGEYWITSATPSRSRRGTPAIALRGSTLDAYLSRVELQDDLFYAGQDQVDIARGLLNHLMARNHANISLVLQDGTSGVPRDRTYLESEGGTYGARLLELAQVDNGFEWSINLEVVDGALVRRWVWGYPTLGTLDPPPHLFADGRSGGDILEWSEEIDALRGATRWRARGSSASTDASTSGTPLVSTVHEATAHLAAGWPRLDRTLSYSTVSETSTLEDYAAFWAARAGGALRVDQVTVTFGRDPSLTPNRLGDAARLYFDNEWHRSTWRTRRVIGIAITPTSRSDGKEQAKLILEGQEVPGA